jgi:PhnB protein
MKEPTPMTTHELFAYLHVADAASAIAFYEKAFGATEKYRLTAPGAASGTPSSTSAAPR